MSIRDQELDLVRIAIEENKVLHAILLKAKKNVIESNVKFDQYKRAENMSHMEKCEQEIYDKVEELHDNVRVYAKAISGKFKNSPRLRISLACEWMLRIF